MDPVFPMDLQDVETWEEESCPRPPAHGMARARLHKAAAARNMPRRTRPSRNATSGDARATILETTPRTAWTLPDHDDDATEALVHKQLAALVDFCGIDKESVCPTAFTFEQHVAAAQDFRDALDESCNLTLCAVCAIPQANVVSIHIDDLPHKKMLRADEESTLEAPRHGLTVCTLKEVVYCLQPDAVTDDNVSVCHACLTALKGKQIPKESLVRVDTGRIPQSPDPKLDLAPLRMLEERLVSPIRTRGKLVYLIKPDGASNLPPQCRQQCTKGHCIAFPNVEPQQLVDALLMPVNEIPEMLQVVFLNIVTNEVDLEKLASFCKAIHVRGQEVLKWAVHLSRVRLACSTLQYPEPKCRVMP